MEVYISVSAAWFLNCDYTGELRLSRKGVTTIPVNIRTESRDMDRCRLHMD
jgi:hypothetical protein